MKRFYPLLLLFFFIKGFSQTVPVEWRVLPIENLPPDKRPFFYQLLCSPSGSVVLSSTHGLIRYQGLRINFPAVSIMANEKVPMEKINDPHTEDGIKMMCRGSGNRLFFLTATGKVYYINESLIALTGWANPPLYIPVNTKGKTISSIWADEEGDLFVSLKQDSFIIFPGIAKHSPDDGEIDSTGNYISKKITNGSRKIFVPGNAEIYRFSKDNAKEGCILLASSIGLLRFHKNDASIDLLGDRWDKKIITTGIIQEKDGNIWLSTLNNGIGYYDAALNKYSFYNDGGKLLAINSFCKKSDKEFFVAVADSLPAFFNTGDHSFSFMTDTLFRRSKNNTTDIRMDGFGNLFVIKGGAMFYSNSFSANKTFSGINLDSTVYAPFIWDMQINRRPYFEVAKSKTLLPDLKKIELNYDQNQLEFSYSLHEFWDKRNTALAWKVDGLNMDWVDLPQDPQDKFKAKFIPPLQPGKYIFRVRAKVGNEQWRKQEAALIIIIAPPFWQTWWFWAVVAAALIMVVTFFYRRHIFSVRKKEREKVIHEKELVELEAKALRAQMNPHFVFNSLNSIKSLINKNDNEKAAGYLSTFSKLIRTLFQNSDKREVSLYEELETCKLYTQLEKMRFGHKVEFVFDVDESIDLKDFKVPALILQPFIENAIWHGLMPKETGGKITIQVKRIEDTIQCIIEDNGIGRELSMKNKPQYESTHQSKGIGLTKSRLELDKLLNEREDKIFIIDKEDENGKPEGTKVIISFKEV
jgi:anti-sigma regulatory factor (Ser/Thr protein kinase)